MKVDTVYRVTTATHLAAEMVERCVEARFAAADKAYTPLPDLDMEMLIMELEEELKHLRMRFRTERGALTYDQVQEKVRAGVASVSTVRAP